MRKTWHFVDKQVSETNEHVAVCTIQPITLTFSSLLSEATRSLHLIWVLVVVARTDGPHEGRCDIMILPELGARLAMSLQTLILRLFLKLLYRHRIRATFS